MNKLDLVVRGFFFPSTLLVSLYHVVKLCREEWRAFREMW